jgi:eukaryotic-like serine/threonine-protein kinase
MDDAEIDTDPIAPLVDDFVTRARAGENVAIEEYAEKHPQLAERIRRLFPMVRGLEELRSAPDAVSSHFTTSTYAPGTRLGDYRIVREIGRGGMGMVYEAVQESLARRVALKLLPPGRFATPDLVERFRREAKAVASLHHTNIVPVFAVGQEEGTAFYAMQYIDGQSLDCIIDTMRRDGDRILSKREGEPASTDPVTLSLVHELRSAIISPGIFCDTSRGATQTVSHDRDNSISSRPLTSNPEAISASCDRQLTSNIEDPYFCNVAQLGAQAADALAYAHRQGVLHRDIKPSNFLLDTAGTIWLTDFGLAKTTGCDDLTASGDVLGTLRYMPPERLQGHSAPQGDVYGLGVTLYELLTLAPAFAARDRGILLNRLASEAIVSARQLNPHIPRDLDLVIAKATAKDPQDRYETADEFAADLRRFLNDEPVLASQRSRGERIWRWTRKNPRVAALMTTICLLLSTLALGSTYAAVHIAASREREAEARGLAELRAAGEAEQRTIAESHRREAEESFQQARAAVDEFFTLVSENKLLDVPGEQQLRRELLESALRYYRGFANQRGDDPSVRDDHALTLMRVGVLNSELGDVDAALSALGQAAAFQETLVNAVPAESKYRRRLAETYLRLGELHRKPRLEFQESLDYFTSSLAIFQKLATALPDDHIGLHDLASARLHLATLLEDIGRIVDAEAGAKDAESLIRHAMDLDPQNLDYKLTLGRVLFRQVSLSNRTGAYRAAVSKAQEATGIFRKLVVDSPTVIVYRKELGLGMGQLAMALYFVNNLEGARQALDECRQLFIKLAEENPDVIEFTLYLAQANGLLTVSEFIAGRLVPAAQGLTDAMEGIRTLLGRMPDDPFLRIVLVYLYEGLSVTRPDFSLPPQTYEDAIVILTKTLRLPPGNSDSWATRAVCFARLGRWDEAATDLAMALQTAKRDSADYMRMALLRYLTGDLTGYRSACRELLVRSSESKLPVNAALIIPVILLGSDAVGSYEPLYKLVDEAGGITARSLLLGGLDYRGGDPKLAVERLEQARTLLTASSLIPLGNQLDPLLLRTCNELFLCRAYGDLGEERKAKLAREQANGFLRRAEGLMAQGRSQMRGAPWEIEALVQCLRRDLDTMSPAPTVSAP